MADKVTLNYTFSVNGDKLKINKSGNYKETLSEISPMHGVYLATLVLALDLVVHKDGKLLDVIKLLGSPEDIERVEGAIEAIGMLVAMDNMKEEMKKAEKADQN